MLELANIYRRLYSRLFTIIGWRWCLYNTVKIYTRFRY